MLAVEGVREEVHGIVRKMAQTELQQELMGFEDDQNSPGEDSESMSSWRTGPEETEKSLEKWGASLEPELELSDMEESEGSRGQEEQDGEDEVEREAERNEEETMS